MLQKKECVAMLLAGGQGSRLYNLTEKNAKPAVPFGGKYRIIDFTMSNCINSGIDTVGVLTQYQPMELNEYIGNGQPWDLDRMNGGVKVLPPYQRSKSADWYKGTGILDAYDEKEIEIWNVDKIDVEEAKLGLNGSPTRVKKSFTRGRHHVLWQQDCE